MDVWVWILVYTLLFALVQLLLYRYLHDDEGGSLSHSLFAEGTTPDEGDAYASSSEAAANDRAGDRRPPDAPNLHQCPHCGIANDTTYTFCRNCVRHLGG